MNPFTVLGVPRDADAATIKRAYRSKAKGLHPDRSQGDHEQMAALNVAYDILSDPDRRARWEASGDEQRFVKPEEQHARELVMALFVEAMQPTIRVNVPAEVQQRIRAARQECGDALKQLNVLEARWEAMKGEILTDEPENIAEALIEQQLRGFAEKRATVERDLSRLNLALEIAQRYRQGTPGDPNVYTTTTTTEPFEAAEVLLRMLKGSHRKGR